MRQLLRRAAAGVLIVTSIAACSHSRADALQHIKGVQVDPVRPKPDFTLQSTDGKTFHFAKDTRGTATFLYFGYTNCPDACPDQLNKMASAYAKLTPEQRSKVRVVFVTTDPNRDTAERLRSWLDNFNKDFIGLRGPLDQVNQIQAQLGLPPAEIEMVHDTTPGPHTMSYGVGHAAQVLGFTPDDSLRVEYPSGFTVPDWTNDMQQLIKID
ncbi:MAG TPA: SCO family protein [Gemmatimonadaceae bacterium]|nr:SCO family protein [Gemmatimonadaceae bacterium]